MMVDWDTQLGEAFIVPCDGCSHISPSEEDLLFHKETCHDKVDVEKLTGTLVGESDIDSLASYQSSVASDLGCDRGSIVERPRRIVKKLTNNPVYQCNLCSKEFVRKWLLEKHLKTHPLEQDPLNISDGHSAGMVDLDVKFGASEISRVSSLKYDLEVSNKKGKNTYHCDICSKNFTLKDSYFRHMRIHSGERPYTCHICGKSFRDSGGLARHLKDVHAGIKKFTCDICGRSFASKATREDHRRIHTGERPYVCDSCGKTFKSKASLYLHSKIHTDSFPHPCTHCEKRFRRRQEFLAHVTTHTGEKPHPCDTCGKSFRVKGELLRHKLIHSESKPHICSACGLSFRQKRYLKNHEKSRHGPQDAALATHLTMASH